MRKYFAIYLCVVIGVSLLAIFQIGTMALVSAKSLYVFPYLLFGLPAALILVYLLIQFFIDWGDL